MSILITGANGLIGNDLVKKLSNKHKIFGIYRTKNDKIKKIKNVSWLKHDLKNDIKIKLRPTPKYIIHCAVTHEFSKRNTISDYLDSNIISLNNIANYAKRNKAKLIINLSTITVYGEVKKNLLNENYFPQKQNILGLTKMISEQLLYDQKMNFINIRLPGILCESCKKNSFRPWLNNVFHKIKKNQNVDVYNLNSKFNNVIDTDEIKKFIGFLIKKNAKIRNTFNFACSQPQTLSDILNNAKLKLNSKSKIKKISSRKNIAFIISTNKLKKKLNYTTNSTNKIINKYLKNFA